MRAEGAVRGIVIGILTALLVAECGEARELYVNPSAGNDSADGLSATAAGGHGPVKTIAQAVRLAGPGDTVCLGGFTFKGNKEYIGIYGPKSGEPGKPITVDGQGAVIDGSVPLDPKDWQEVAPGLYRNLTIFQYTLHKSEDWVDCFCFVFEGRLNRMGHSQKAPRSPYKKPSELQPGEWTYQKEDEHTFYIKIDPQKTLADCKIEVPVINSGVQIDGTVSHIMFKNITVTHVINDGFALTVGRKPGSNEVRGRLGQGNAMAGQNAGAGTAPPRKVRDIAYENIKAIAICDDAFSAHSDCEVRVDGLLCDDCSTGIASSGTSVNTNVVMRNIHGMDIILGGGNHVVRNSRIFAHGASGAIILANIWYKDVPGLETCSLKLENVVMTGTKGEPGIPNLIQVSNVKASLEFDRCTIAGMKIAARNGGGLKIARSILAGSAGCSMDIQADSRYEADGNIYDLEFIRVGNKSYSAKDFAAYTTATGQDATSQWMTVDLNALLGGVPRFQIGSQPVGADMSVIPR